MARRTRPTSAKPPGRLSATAAVAADDAIALEQHLISARAWARSVGEASPTRLATPRPTPGRALIVAAPAAAAARPRESAERREGVVGDEPGPDEVPNGLDDRLHGRADGGLELADKRRAAGLEVAQNGALQLRVAALWELAVGGIQKRAEALAPVEGDPAVAAPERPPPDPNKLPERAELVEHRAAENRRSARGKRRASSSPKGRRESLELRDGAAEGAQTSAASADPLPLRQEAPECGRVDRRDLVAKGRQRAAAEATEDLGIAEFFAATTGTKSALKERLGGDESPQRRPRLRAGHPEALANVGGGEGAAGAGESRKEHFQRLLLAGEKGDRRPRRRHRSQGIAIAARVLEGDPPLVPGDPHAICAALAAQRFQRRFRIDFRAARKAPRR